MSRGIDVLTYAVAKAYTDKKVDEGGGGGTSNFNQLTNRPSYDNTTMTGSTSIPKVPTATSELNNDSGFITSSALPTVNDATLTITQNGTSVGTFTANDADDTTIALNDTTYSDFTGTDGSSTGAAGLVPAPVATDAGKFLKADGTWDTAGGGSGPTVVQTTGTSTTDVMSQNAVTSMVFADPATQYKIKIGAGTSTDEGIDSVEIGHNAVADGNESISLGKAATVSSNGAYGVALGSNSNVQGARSVAIGNNASTLSRTDSVAIGAYTKVTTNGTVAIGGHNATTGHGYNGSQYRLLTGVYDGQSAHDAATVGQITPFSGSSAPTTATVGTLGKIFIDTTNADAYMCVAVDDVTPSYTWKKITA